MVINCPKKILLGASREKQQRNLNELSVEMVISKSDSDDSDGESHEESGENESNSSSERD
eukprot:11567110-Ditylum_brightwellii.AAC.1